MEKQYLKRTYKIKVLQFVNFQIISSTEIRRSMIEVYGLHIISRKSISGFLFNRNKKLLKIR